MQRTIVIPDTGPRLGGAIFAFAAALGLILAVVGSRWIEAEPTAEADAVLRIVGAVFALAFGLGAVGMLTLEIEVRVADGEVGVVTRRFGRSKVRTLPLDGIGVVLLEETTIPTGSQSRMDVWPIRYVHADGRLELHRALDAAAGREWCERLAKMLDVPMVDATLDEPCVRAADEVDASVVDRTCWSELCWPVLPRSDRVRAEVRGETVSVFIGPRGFGSPVVYSIAFVAVGAWGLARFADEVRAGLNVWGWLFAPIYALLFGGFGCLGLWGLWNAFWGTEALEVDRGSVRVGSALLEAAEIEEIALGAGGDTVVVRGDETTMVLGSGLTRGQAVALRDMALLALGGRIPR
ncbi:MAG: hypothetical protein GY711_06835 [bacterium]|nr:hypothetical protein [bacterium]